MQDKRTKPEAEMLRNTLTIRWPDGLHRRLVDEAWRRRLHASDLVRDYVAKGLEADGVAAEPAEHYEAPE